MFARTKRLTLRPPWPEDAADLACAIAHEAVAHMLARVPYPYTVDDARAFTTLPRGGHDTRFLILAHDDATPRLIGGIGIQQHDGEHQLGYWLTPASWGRGYATEAAQAVVAMARDALPIAALHAWHFADNPASGRVLRKLGFRPTGVTTERPSLARETWAPSVAYALDLDAERCAAIPLAA
ncbi:MAG TPA: GNAT family N-acetyltransferase [Sphingomonas sp.]|jgi:RimJ/RimL family protein N-acetyltransferase|nr:GNAT family N-acetyltransferase [Sphingomonas sp.]